MARLSFEQLIDDLARHHIVRVVANEGEEDDAVAVSRLLLVRKHRHCLSLSLPTDRAWSVSSQAEWKEVREEVIAALAQYLGMYPMAVCMSDVLLRLTAALPSGDPGWEATFPGTPIPSEAWLRQGEQSIGLFQQDQAVMVVVWVSGGMHSKTIDSPDALGELDGWIGPELAAQAKGLEAAKLEKAREEERQKSLPVPTLQEVLAAMRAGKRFQVGSGRCHTGYFMKDGKLFYVAVDEAYCDDGEMSEEALAAEIARRPEEFR